MSPRRKTVKEAEKTAEVDVEDQIKTDPQHEPIDTIGAPPPDSVNNYLNDDEEEGEDSEVSTVNQAVSETLGEAAVIGGAEQDIAANQHVEVSSPIAKEKLKENFARILQLAQGLGAQPAGKPKGAFDFNDPELSPVVLDVIFTGIWGTDAWGWEPEAFDFALGQIAEYGIQLSQENRDKVQAMFAIHVTNMPWTDWHVFEKTCMALNGASPQFDHIEDATPGMILSALDIMKNTGSHSFTPQVIKYIGTRCVYHGQVIFPDDDFQEAVEAEIRNLIKHDVDDKTYEGLKIIWQSFIQSGIENIEPDQLDSLSEEELGDVQVLKAYMSLKYKNEEFEKMKSQLNDLAAYAISVLE